MSKFIENDQLSEVKECTKSEPLSEVSSLCDEEEEDELEKVLYYCEEDVKEAKRLGMDVEEMLKMYEFINSQVDDEQHYCEEWPSIINSYYEDEGMEESMY
tara:strand:- start:1682 stop:1984 length:303 start_codon:yes stop_codon:yes gene_type:complete